jgi:hypothetical protein
MATSTTSTKTDDKETATQIAQTVSGVTPAGTQGLGSALPGSGQNGTSVSDRLSAITSSGSPVMKQAEAAGLRTASRRGLGNSSMAVQAAQGSVLSAATPIASQEAQQIANAELADADAREKARLQRESLDANAQLADKDIAAKSALQRESLDATAANTAATIAADERSRLAAALSDLSSQRFNAYSQTLNNDKIKADARASVQNSLNAQYQSTVNYLQNLYGVALNNTAPSTGTPADGSTTPYTYAEPISGLATRPGG